MQNTDLTKKMNHSISRLAKTALKIVLSDFSKVSLLAKTLRYQKKSAAIRSAHEKKGFHVPPFLIASIVRSCNLKCKGCYDKAKPAVSAPELEAPVWVRVFAEARDLGISFILLAGGEPLLKETVIRECINFPEIIFPVFTNGLLINDSWIEYFCAAQNVVPVVSIEGDENLTNERRGSGIYEKVEQNFAFFKKKKILYGLSITLTSRNYSCVISKEYIRCLFEGGARVFFFIDYIPFDSSTESLQVTASQKEELPIRLKKLRADFGAIFLDFPGGEELFGGCLASGRGFVHINAAGGIEPCPFVPYSDTSVSDSSLTDAISSPLLARIRALQETIGFSGGCTLFENREAVEGMLSENRKE